MDYRPTKYADSVRNGFQFATAAPRFLDAVRFVFLRVRAISFLQSQLNWFQKGHVSRVTPNLLYSVLPFSLQDLGSCYSSIPTKHSTALFYSRAQCGSLHTVAFRQTSLPGTSAALYQHINLTGYVFLQGCHVFVACYCSEAKSNLAPGPIP